MSLGDVMALRDVTVSNSVWYTMSPLEPRDARAIGAQWATMVRSLARSYVAIGLIAEDHPVATEGKGGLSGALGAATEGWRRRWGPSLAQGWVDGEGEGALGRIGGVVMAACCGRDKIINDSVAIIVGWSIIGALWCGIGWMLAEMLVATANAQTAAGGATSTDLARGMLSDMLPFLGTGGTVLAQGLGKMAEVMSIVAIGAAGLGFILTGVLMLAEYTWSPDTAKGRHAPAIFVIRGAILFGLLWPLPSGWGGGQVISANFIAWGSDKASAAWVAAVSYLSDSGKWLSQPTVSQTEAAGVVAAIFRNEACMAAWNYDPRRTGTVSDSASGSGIDYNETDNDGILFSGTQHARACGSIQYATAPAGSNSTTMTQLLQNQKDAAEAMRANLRSIIAPIAQGIWATIGTPSSSPVAGPTALGPAITTYYSNLTGMIGNTWTGAAGDLQAQLRNVGTGQGWVGAGQWVSTIARTQGTLAEAGAGLPSVSPPTNLGDDQIKGVYEALDRWGIVGLVASNNATATPQGANGGGGFLGFLNSIWQNNTKGLWDSLVTLDQVDPLAQVATLGYKMYYGGIIMMGTTAAIAAAGTDGSLLNKLVLRGGAGLATGGVAAVGMAALSGIGGVVAQLMPFITTIGTALVVIGMALAYLVPALPTIRFLFAVLQWLIAVMETVILVPAMLVLMVTGEQGGILGPAAKAGFWNIVAVIIRPGLTIMGLILGILMIGEAVKMLNAIMLPWIISYVGGGNLTTVGPISFVAFGVIYFIVVYGFVNTLTKMPESLPLAVYRWIGANSSGERDDAAAIAGISAGITNRLLQRNPRSPKAK